jgi:DNA-binding transcriptional ArsR family regulator
MSLRVSRDDPDDRDRAAVARLRAFAHPVRLQMLSLLTGAALTATDVARELGITHANASYHLRHLLAAGQIEVAGEEQIRGGIARRYRYRVQDEQHMDPGPDGPPLPETRLVYAALAQELTRRAGLVRGRRGNHLTDAELWVTPEVWADIRRRISDASTELHRAAEPPRTPGTVRVNATIALFEMVPASPEVSS